MLVWFLDEVVFGEKSLKNLTVWELIKGDPPANVLKAFVFVGIPCLLYTCWGIWKFKELKYTPREGTN